MVNTCTDAELSAAVQNALQTLLPQIRVEIREEFRTSSGPVVIGINRPLNRVVTGTTVIIMTVMDKTGEAVVTTTAVATTTTLATTTGFQQSRGPSEGYSYLVCTTCGRRHPGECRRATGTCFKCGQNGHLQKDCKKNTVASTSGQADKKPGASGRVFAITKDHATKTSEHHATIDCRSYRVIFGDIHAPEFIYHGSLPRKSIQIISALQARTLMSHGCEGFLATIHDTTSD
nr:reverse transcriptase domain-containing protein [Tanacetum cinerariifolium]